MGFDRLSPNGGGLSAFALSLSKGGVGFDRLSPNGGGLSAFALSLSKGGVGFDRLSPNGQVGLRQAQPERW